MLEVQWCLKFYILRAEYEMAMVFQMLPLLRISNHEHLLQFQNYSR